MLSQGQIRTYSLHKCTAVQRSSRSSSNTKKGSPVVGQLSTIKATALGAVIAPKIKPIFDCQGPFLFPLRCEAIRRCLCFPRVPGRKKYAFIRLQLSFIYCIIGLFFIAKYLDKHGLSTYNVENKISYFLPKHLTNHKTAGFLSLYTVCRFPPMPYHIAVPPGSAIYPTVSLRRGILEQYWVPPLNRQRKKQQQKKEQKQQEQQRHRQQK